jgi:uncharacterized protein (TIRG00374 family)
VFLSIGAGVFYYLYKDQDFSKLWSIIENEVNFWWVGLSLVLGVLAHLSRALRWRMLIEPVEKKTTWYNTFMAVLVGYLANLVLPRMGEVTRCGVLSKYEKISFTRLVGTVLAERLTDLLMLLTLVLFSFAIKFNMLAQFFKANLSTDKIESFFKSGFTYLALAILVIGIYLLKKYAHKIVILTKFRGVWQNFVEGFASIKNVRSKKVYLFYSVFIWLMYFGMQYTCFFAMKETSNLTVSAGIIILVTGSIGMLAPVQGGIGPWHAMVIATLAIYGVTEEPAYAFALLVHGAQNLLVVFLGLISLVLFPLVNTKSKT